MFKLKSLAAFLLLLLPGLLFAQDENLWKPASRESQAYHAYRMKTTTPPYGLAKVQKLITKINSDDEGNSALTTKEYLGLSLRERFTYNMIHGESYSQICDLPPVIQEEQKKILGNLLDAFGENNWSTRQTDFLAGNRDSVMAIIMESAKRSKRIGLNYKLAIEEIKGVELIPFLVDFYTPDHKDLDILTLLMLLMKDANYEPFKSSASYTKLYGKESDYYNFLQYNKANEELIIKRAMALYNSKFK